jgi:hypothetical protein
MVFVTIAVGDLPRTARPLVVSGGRHVIAAVIRAIAARASASKEDRPTQTSASVMRRRTTDSVRTS